MNLEMRHFQDKNIMIVIAHPDDEVMFFGPALIGITKETYGNKVRILCLSKGISAGKVAKKAMRRASVRLERPN
jgi:N-acetylglucosaminylphosphatidylinositol deacetylase